MFKRIISGGQTGVDRAGLDAALHFGVSAGGWCPAGRLAEDGTIPDRYPLTETESADYKIRTEWNIRDSDATLILNLGPLEGGTAYTVDMARQHHKPCLVVQLDAAPSMSGIVEWIQEINPAVLNIAGPRESKVPDVHAVAYEFLLELCQEMACSTSV